MKERKNERKRRKGKHEKNLISCMHLVDMLQVFVNLAPNAVQVVIVGGFGTASKSDR